MYKINYHNPTNLVFGVGIVSLVGDLAARCGGTCTVLAGCSHLESTNELKKLQENLRLKSVKYSLFDGISPNPTLESIQRIAREHLARPGCIIAIGGGSVIDAAKLLSLILTHSGDPWEYRVTGSIGVQGIKDSMIPVIAVPTTAGTGSEISPAALISHNHKKEVYFSPFMFPRAAVVDPDLCLSLPIEQTARSGFDAFVQSLEAFVSISSQPFSDLFAVRSMQLILSSLPKLVMDSKNVELRSDISFAGILSCYAIGQAGVGAAHALSNPVSGRHNIGHGLALSILLPSVMRANIKAGAKRYGALAEFLGVATSELDEQVAASQMVNCVESLIAQIGLGNHRLSDFGVKDEELSLFADEAQNPDMSTNPVKLTQADCIEIFRQVF